MTSQDSNQASQGCLGGLVKKLVKDASPTFFPFELTLKSPPNYSPKFPVALATGPSSYMSEAGPVLSYNLRYIVGSGLVEMDISTNLKPAIYRNVYENTASVARQISRCPMVGEPEGRDCKFETRASPVHELVLLTWNNHLTV